MPDRHELELFISDDGELKVHIKGIKGPGCLKVLDSLTKEIGPKKEIILNTEYYESQDTKDKPKTQIKKN